MDEPPIRIIVKRIQVTTYVAYHGSEPAYVSFFQMEPGVWEIGKTHDEALMRLLISNKDRFNIVVETQDEE